MMDTNIHLVGKFKDEQFVDVSEKTYIFKVKLSLNKSIFTHFYRAFNKFPLW